MKKIISSREKDYPSLADWQKIDPVFYAKLKMQMDADIKFNKLSEPTEIFIISGSGG